MKTALPDVYQDGVAPGSLANARRCWLYLTDTEEIRLPQQFTFVFRCPSRQMALGLMDFLRSTQYTGFVRTSNDGGVAQGDPWQVTGTSHSTIWSLPSLEHLFMDLRGAGSRYASVLETLELAPTS